MKSKLFFLACIFFMGISIFFFSCKKNQSKVEQFPEPQIVAGIAKIKGKLNDVVPNVEYLTFKVNNPVTAGVSIIESKVESDGSFYFEVPIECVPCFGTISSTSHYGTFIELSSDKEMFVELKSDQRNYMVVVSATEQYLLTNEDKTKYAVARTKYSTSNSQYINPQICEITPEEYVRYEMDVMHSRIDYAMKDLKFSDKGRIFVLNELKLHHQGGTLLSYKSRVEMLCSDKNDRLYQEPDIQYYSFLKSFELNNPQYIYNFLYQNTMQALLSTKAFNIPAISDTPAEEWLTNVKAVLSDLLGFDSGQFYDLLVANSYAMQFNDEVIPLSDKQKNNIKEYFGDGEIAKILLRKNEEVIKLAEEKSGVFVNKTPDVPKEQLMNAIISKYKNKVVFVDFWATWCVPCLNAMAQFSTVKSQLKDKDIAFVYLTNSSSPKELWSKKINSIPGEHYYLNGEEWEYLMKNFGFNAIPSYVIFDTKGKISAKFTAYPGNAKIQAMIEKLF